MISKTRLNFEAEYTSFATGTGIFAIYFMISSMTLAAPVIAGLYNLQPSVTGFIIQAHLIGTVLFLLPAAKIGDIIGHEKILYMGGIFFSLSSLLCVISLPELLGGAELIMFRFTQGIGDGMIMASSLVLLSRKWKAEQRGKSLGIFLFAGYMGYISGLLIGGWLIDVLNWRAPFLVTVPITLLTGIAGYKLYRLSKSKNTASENTGKKFDFRGMILFGPGIVLLTAGLSQIPSKESAFLIISGIVLFILLIFHEKNIEYPLFEISLFKNNRVFSLAILSDLLYYSGIGAISYLISTYLEVIRNFNSLHAALIILPISLIQGLASPVAGKLSDRIDPKYISGTGLAIIIIVLLVYSRLNTDTTIIMISTIAALAGGGFALFSSPNKNAIMSSVGTKDHGNASGLANTFEQTGNLISIGIAVAILTFITGGTTSASCTPDLLLKSMDLIFLILTVICLINIIIILIRGNLKQQN